VLESTKINGIFETKRQSRSLYSAWTIAMGIEVWRYFLAWAGMLACERASSYLKTQFWRWKSDSDLWFEWLLEGEKPGTDEEIAVFVEAVFCGQACEGELGIDKL
jgi:hypothetical protein